MDTNLKNYKHSDKWAGTAFWLCALPFAAAMLMLVAIEAIDRGVAWLELSFENILFPMEYMEYGINIQDTPLLRDIRAILLALIVAGVICSVIAIISFFVCLINTGRKRDENGEILTKAVDKIPTELQIIAFFILGTLGAWALIEIWEQSAFRVVLECVRFGRNLNNVFIVRPDLLAALILSAIAAVLCAVVGFWMLVSVVRKLKAGTFIKYSIFGMLLLQPIKSLYKSSSPMRKLVLLALAVCLLSATVFLAPVVFIAILVLSPKWIRKYEEVKKGIDQVCAGNLSYKIPLQGDGELEQLAGKINSIAEASSKAVENELRNQKMKTELISNVSHDLKTPLTSIITYVDLLKKEGLDSENAEEYVEVLDQKAKRLKQLTDDLFEAAKASSGAMPINMGNVDVVSVVNQTLGELDEKIKGANLTFIFGHKEEKYFAKADGQQLWRVLENLVGNTLKYAVPGSRVYVDVGEGKLSADKNINANSTGATNANSNRANNAGNAANSNNANNVSNVAGFNNTNATSGAGNHRTGTGNTVRDAVIIEIKNMSTEQLNIDANTLMERFTRGDSARSTEGSGLGLAISRDLVKLMGGEMEILIDGDLFKVKVRLEKGFVPQAQETKQEI